VVVQDGLLEGGAILKRLLASLLVGVAFLAIPGSVRADFFRIQIRDSFFTPADITILPFDGINWSWLPGLLPHSATADDNSWDSGLHNSPHVYRRLFTEPGDYPYYCSLHGSPGGVGMAGIIRVSARDYDDEDD
jgi:plastocyanin